MATISEVRPDGVHVLDPRGDVILVLEDPHLAQENAEPEPSPEEEMTPLIPEEAPAEETTDSIPEFYTPLPESEKENLEPEPEPSVPEAPIPEPNGDYPDPDEIPVEVPPPAPELEQGHHNTRVLVSSSILRLASPLFAALLENAATEDKIPNEHSPPELDFTDLEDPDAFISLLKIMHLRTRSVPRTVGLEKLTQLAKLVDQFGCHEAVELFSDGWIDSLQSHLPTDMDGFSEDICRWICIAWVFGREREFKIATKVAQRCACKPLDCREYPIPKETIDSINRTRNRALVTLLLTLNDLVDTYQTSLSAPRCSDECDSLVLGALTRRLKARGLLEWLSDPYPYVPHVNGPAIVAASSVVPDFSVRSLAAWVRELELPSVHGRLWEAAAAVEAPLLPPPLAPEEPPLPPPAVEVPDDGDVVQVVEAVVPGGGGEPDDWGVWGTSTVKGRRNKRKVALREEVPPPPPPWSELDAEPCDPLAGTKARVAEIEAGLRGLDIESLRI
ncbi:uncharacterized protein LTHEOB_4008 [Lasiodiplodia theobromae]|uniref:uncharacterized protein n=1 Tax=Lasiodiplodia theobromae TaxID=45133 RepID=UPI0015C2EAA7|nr:uncharacterized protein LTHEOB_4008 [Lasiodiplodia theobromae]KAF4546700.1 hypothetical protein LTHEOB_4008 [Lasiodiplodia theobromae]